MATKDIASFLGISDGGALRQDSAPWPCLMSSLMIQQEKKRCSKDYFLAQSLTHAGGLILNLKILKGKDKQHCTSRWAKGKIM